jgi:hypothetical protein
MGNVIVFIQLMELYVDIDVINCKLCGDDRCALRKEGVKYQHLSQTSRRSIPLLYVPSPSHNLDGC